MIDVVGKVMISFNGEIYNYKELAHQLRARGAVFKTKSDTEVIIHAYEVWGVESFEKLNGMFSFALWDDRYGKLFLVRDRFGKKPLYYCQTKNGLVFASELSALLYHPSVVNSINYGAVRQYLSLNYTLTSNSIIADIKKLPPASYLCINSLNNPKIYQYWNYAQHFLKEKSSLTVNEAEEELAYLLQDAAHIRTRMDVPYCALLSGGMDSTAVTLALSKECSN
jgi:asparagine synthase (glutamine-hydrolysing)